MLSCALFCLKSRLAILNHKHTNQEAIAHKSPRSRASSAWTSMLRMRLECSAMSAVSLWFTAWCSSTCPRQTSHEQGSLAPGHTRVQAKPQPRSQPNQPASLTLFSFPSFPTAGEVTWPPEGVSSVSQTTCLLYPEQPTDRTKDLFYRTKTDSWECPTEYIASHCGLISTTKIMQFTHPLIKKTPVTAYLPTSKCLKPSHLHQYFPQLLKVCRKIRFHLQIFNGQERSHWLNNVTS